ncbi:MAG: sigma-70 family RNA polymerase sigma factor [Acidobacteriaceae bacterium]|nr:sigma-70 family RNA polymerase sigma factor [Acidobacteriaceae bacterium]
MSSGPADAEHLYGKSRAAELGFSREAFAAMLDGIIRHSFPDGCTLKEREQFLLGLHLEDLVLARGCAGGLERAWDRFLLLYREKLYRAASAITGNESIARELADSLYADLFGMKVENGERRSKLESYGGRGSLEGWLRTVLAQAYVNRYRRERRTISFEEAMETPVRGETAKQVSASDQVRVAQVTDAALAALSSEDQFLLAIYYLDGRTLAEIGRILSLHESTVSRRIGKIISDLRKRIIKELCRGGMSKQAAEEILEMDVRDVGVDVRHRLAQERQGESFPH